jgi:hypothetical protein
VPKGNTPKPPRPRDQRGRWVKVQTPEPLPSWYHPPIIQGRADFWVELTNCLQAPRRITIYDTRDL